MGVIHLHVLIRRRHVLILRRVLTRLIHYVVLQAPAAHKVPEARKEQQAPRVQQEHKDFKVFQERIPIQAPQAPRVQQEHKDFKVYQEPIPIQAPQAPRVQQGPVAQDQQAHKAQVWMEHLYL